MNSRKKKQHILNVIFLGKKNKKFRISIGLCVLPVIKNCLNILTHCIPAEVLCICFILSAFCQSLVISLGRAVLAKE
jgi:hypothetical protein